ncbi:C40 family peptidase [Maribacter thermophilus]|uniref:C40 family peptidase n=1 Tax=Maribacter thermophilus TaxID=1197874 RepID=UPI000641202C|nr:C40 family peptidase [Maribacter thermophilus]
MRTLTVIILLTLVASCGTSKKSVSIKDRTVSVAAADKERRGIDTPPKENTNRTKPRSPKKTKADEVINTALTFSGVRYKFGGTTKKGMDCSGLLYVSFGEHDIQLPRTSASMAQQGKKIRIKDVEKGDLLFFKTSKGAKRINHVGMVVKVEKDEIKFIHASTSRGVTISSLREGFWNQAFVKATRIL